MIREALEKLAAIEATLEVDGFRVQRVYTYPPTDPPEELPFAVNMPDRGTVERLTAASWLIRNDIVVVLVIARIEGGTGIGDLVERAIRWRDAFFRQLFRSTELFPDVIWAGAIGWEIIQTRIGSANWLALRFTIRMEEEQQ